ncbi:DUF354 domain-containing protein [Salinarchaeum laminariae]|uniref:DUF354 domain-containing protein n=1 Tax=Salinarchaeum laminariae TaxID=869888 RepID=UPI0020BFB64A|nr:DUF354 domain-containing protein [Salinarchaeum laminariae]
MKILFDLTHPAHVHLFRNSIDELQNRGHEIVVASREKDLTTELLDHYNIEHSVLSKRRDGTLPLLLEWPLREIRTAQFYRSEDPDVVVSRFNPAASHAACLLGIPHLVFDDTEDKPAFVRRTANPFSDVIYTPECFSLDLGESQVRYPGYHELAYLHPDHFEPDSSILKQHSLTSGRFAVIRLVAWDAVHDVGHGGFNDPDELISLLESVGVTPVITSENDLPEHLEQYQADIPVHQIHHLLYYADIFIGESATMATESAVLGTPAVFVSSTRRGYTDELEEKYGLVFTFSGDRRHERALERITEVLKTDSEEWAERRDVILQEKINTTEFILQEVEDLDH